MALYAKNQRPAHVERLLVNFLRMRQGKKAKPTEMMQETDLSPRRIRSALHRLEERKLVVKEFDLTDLRTHYYRVRDEVD